MGKILVSIALLVGFVTAIFPDEQLIWYEPSEAYLGMVRYQAHVILGCRVALYRLELDGWEPISAPFLIGHGDTHAESIPASPKLECVEGGLLVVSSVSKILPKPFYTPLILGP